MIGQYTVVLKNGCENFAIGWGFLVRDWELSEGLSKGVPWTFGGTGNWELGIGISSDLEPGSWRLAP